MNLDSVLLHFHFGFSGDGIACPVIGLPEAGFIQEDSKPRGIRMFIELSVNWVNSLKLFIISLNIIEYYS